MAAEARVRWFHRLYLRIYLSVLAIVAVLGLMLGLAFYSHANPREFSRRIQATSAVAQEVLPPLSAPDADLQAALVHWTPLLDSELALYAPNGRVVASTCASAVPPLDISRLGASPPDYPIPLRDGRWLLVRGAPQGDEGPHRLAVFATLVAVAVALGCYPLVRRLTRRIEVLQRGVERWGEGGLSARVAMNGQDEVAWLARSFNAAAGHIENLVRAQKSLLSNASHELRSPLARMRLGVELLPDNTPAALLAEFKQNIVELDGLVGEILLASRLDAQGETALARKPLDFTALASQECAAAGVPLEAMPAMVIGDAVLLRRVLRNLIENAQRHGGAGAAAQITTLEDRVILSIRDEGPGIPDAERERVFEPFYRLPGSSEASGGVGLGLSLVRQIAQAHGGTVECLAATHAGACFQLSLPRA